MSDVVLSVSGLALTHRNAGARAVDDVSFEVRRGEIFSLLGPSGCGKTTTLRSIAGFERPEAGTISLDGRVLFSAAASTNVPASRRSLGMVFQNYGIWPHMSVRQNAAYPLTVQPRGKRPSKKAIAERVERVLAVVGLEHTLDRKSTALSGGQQQRLALARAIISEPALLLLDEPVSNLDARVRDDVLVELRRLQGEHGMTMLYVTHDQREALALSNTVAVMDRGRLVQTGSAADIYDRPATRFVANFIGHTNLLDGTVAEVGDGGRCTVTTPIGTVPGIALDAPHIGAEMSVAIRPETLHFAAASSNTATCWEGVVRSRMYFGEVVEHVVDVRGWPLKVRCRPYESQPIGQSVFVHLQHGDAAVFLT